MRRIRFLLLASAFAAAALAPASAATEESSTARPARTASGTNCFVSSRHLTGDVDAAKQWNGKRRAAFAKLRAAADAFASAVALHETDRNLADGGCSIVSAEAVERHVFRRALETLLAETRRSAPVMTFREADGALNAAYRDVMAVGEPKDLAWGSVDKAGIRKAERAWIAYRDAFVAFAATFAGSGAAERLAIDLTMQRTASLEAFLAD